MKRMNPAAFACLSLLAGCQTPAAGAPPEDAALRRLMAQTGRVESVGLRIEAANAARCPVTVAKLGAWLSSARDFPPEQQASARRALGMNDTLRVVRVAKGSPADLAGVRPGDRLAAINGGPSPPGAVEARRWVGDSLIKARPGQTIAVVVERRGQHLRLTAPHVLHCNYPIYLSDSEAAAATARLRGVAVTPDQLASLRRDDDLALVLAHQLAHHASPKTLEEADVDRVGASFAAKAGYGLAGLAKARTGFHARGPRD